MITVLIFRDTRDVSLSAFHYFKHSFGHNYSAFARDPAVGIVATIQAQNGMYQGWDEAPQALRDKVVPEREREIEELRTKLSRAETRADRVRSKAPNSPIGRPQPTWIDAGFVARCRCACCASRGSSDCCASAR